MRNPIENQADIGYHAWENQIGRDSWRFELGVGELLSGTEKKQKYHRSKEKEYEKLADDTRKQLNESERLRRNAEAEGAVVMSMAAVNYTTGQNPVDALEHKMHEHRRHADTFERWASLFEQAKKLEPNRRFTLTVSDAEFFGL